MPQTEEATLLDLARGKAKASGDKYTFVIERVTAKIFEIEDSNFQAGSAVMLPLPLAPVRDSGAFTVSSLASIAAALAFAESASEKLCVMAHCAPIAPAADQQLSTLRAKHVELFLRGDRDGWAASCDAHRVEDYQHILTWAAIAHGYGCDPRGVGNPRGPSTERALVMFREAYNADFGAQLELEGPIRTEDWAAFYDLYDRALAQRLDVEPSALGGKRGALVFYAPPSLGCAAHWPALPNEGLRSEVGKRVELVFIPESDLPDFAADARPGATLYRPGGVVRREYQPIAAEPVPLKLKLLDGFREPIKSRPFTLAIGETIVLEGSTNDSGELETEVPPAALRGELSVTLSDEEESTRTWQLLLGRLPPIERDVGVQARLNLLGVDSGEPADDGQRMQQGLYAYQYGREDLEPTGSMDDDTRKSADDEHKEVLA